MSGISRGGGGGGGGGTRWVYDNTQLQIYLFLQDSSDQVPDQQLNDAAATAESLQPKGFTLSTTEVFTYNLFFSKRIVFCKKKTGKGLIVKICTKVLSILPLLELHGASLAR